MFYKFVYTEISKGRKRCYGIVVCRGVQKNCIKAVCARQWQNWIWTQGFYSEIHGIASEQLATLSSRFQEQGRVGLKEI